MRLRRTIVALLLSLTLVFQPMVATAMVQPCVDIDTSSTEGTSGSSGVARVPTKCPCEGTMPGCASMAQCQVGPECATQCLQCVGVLPTSTLSFRLFHLRLVPGRNERRASLALAPPAPPPRA